MKRAEVEIGGVYRAKVSGKVVEVRIVGPSYLGGWNADNLVTGRGLHIKTAARLQGSITNPRSRWSDSRARSGNAG